MGKRLKLLEEKCKKEPLTWEVSSSKDTCSEGDVLCPGASCTAKRTAPGALRG